MELWDHEPQHLVLQTLLLVTFQTFFPFVPLMQIREQFLSSSN